MVVTLKGETFDIRTDHMKKVERSGSTIRVDYQDGSYQVYSAGNLYQIPKLDLLEIVLKSVYEGYMQCKEDLYKEGRIISEETKTQLEIFEKQLGVFEDLINKPDASKYHEAKIWCGQEIKV